LLIICTYITLKEALMAIKRLTIELPVDQYEFLRKKAITSGTTVSGLIRKIIDECRLRLPKEARKNYRTDPLYKRRGSFDGPDDLAEHHDQYLYGQTS
jgi:hypothetical protein